MQEDRYIIHCDPCVDRTAGIWNDIIDIEGETSC